MSLAKVRRCNILLDGHHTWHLRMLLRAIGQIATWYLLSPGDFFAWILLLALNMQAVRSVFWTCQEQVSTSLKRLPGFPILPNADSYRSERQYYCWAILPVDALLWDASLRDAADRVSAAVTGIYNVFPAKSPL